MDLLAQETSLTVGLLGTTAFAEVEASQLCPATPVDRPHVTSALPLMAENGRSG